MYDAGQLAMIVILWCLAIGASLGVLVFVFWVLGVVIEVWTKKEE